MLAVKHGGGGHKHASGFVCSMTTLHQIIYGS
jgi:nanoRNase/pAp phosphatase (c-di-AMP/oligoRNAs hydrolase)